MIERSIKILIDLDAGVKVQVNRFILDPGKVLADRFGRVRKPMSELTFFSASDKQLESYISYDDFEKSLYLNILFQEGILIPDMFIFVSEYVARHVSSRSSKSLFEAALENGLVVPSFRNPGKVNYRDVLYELEGAGKPERALHGIRSDAGDIASRLQLSAESGRKYRYETWPEFSVGEGFEKVVLEHLSRKELIELPDNAHFQKDELRKLWELTSAWRIDVISEAKDATAKLPIAGVSHGLRRGEIYDAVARRLGLPVPKNGIGDLRDLLSAAKDNEQVYRGVKCFLEWVNECYHLNLSTSLGCAPNFPRFLPPSGFILESILPAGKKATAPQEKHETIVEQVEFPGLDILRKIPGKDLIDIRNDIGQGYIAARKAWQGDPSSANEQKLREIIHQFANELNTFIARKYEFKSNSMLDLILGSQIPRDRVIVEDIINIIQKTAAFATAGGSDLLLAIGKSFYDAHLLRRGDPTKEEVRLFAKRTPPEVLMPESGE